MEMYVCNFLKNNNLLFRFFNFIYAYIDMHTWTQNESDKKFVFLGNGKK